MSNIKSFQRLLVVQALYEISINENRRQIPTKEIFTNIVEQSDYGKKISNKNLKFAEKIYMSSNVSETKWVITIEDDGPGTSLSQEELVKPFTKGSDQLNQGTGLGLSIVQKLIKLNNGDLRFEDSSHGGLKVLISLEINY